MANDSEISVSHCIGKGYERGWWTNCPARYRVFAGARETKKSVNILGYEPIFKLLSDEWRNIAIIRQNACNNRDSTFTNIVSIIDKLGLARYFRIQNTILEIQYLPTGQKIVFQGLANPTAMSSIKAVHGFFSDAYFEEASEVQSFDDFRKVDGSLRMGRSEMERWGIPAGSGNAVQITFLLNPWNRNHWIYETFFRNRLEDDPSYLDAHDYMDYFDPDFSLGYGKGLYLHKSTFRINEFRAPYKDENMAFLKEKAPEIYKVEGLGCWGNSTDQTYPSFSEKNVIGREEALSIPLSCYAIGIDTGLSDGEGKPIRGKGAQERIRSATTMQLVGLSSDGQKLIAVDEWFFTNQGFDKKTHPEIVASLVRTLGEWRKFYAPHSVLMKGVIPVYVDCGDKGTREDLEMEASRQDLLNIRFIPSTKLRIQTRVDFSNQLMAYGKFLFCDVCKNLIREIWNSRKGEKGEPREDFDDHAINANEYAWAPLRNQISLFRFFKEH